MFRNHMWNAMTQPPRLPPMKSANPDGNPMPPAAGFMPGNYSNLAYQMAGFPQGMVMRDPTTPASLPPQAMPPVAPPPADIPMPAPWDILRGLPRGGLGGRFGGIPRLVRPV